MDYGTGTGPTQDNAGLRTRGFFGSLFDFSFNSFVTGRIIGVLYILSIVLIALSTIGFIVGAFNDSAGFGALALLILGPLFFIFATIYVRVILEIAIVLFRIAENTSEMARQGRQVR